VVLRRHLAVAVPRLTAVANDTSQSWELRLRGAEFLLELEQEVGWQTYSQALAASDAATLRTALRSFPEYYDLDGRPAPNELLQQLEKLTGQASPEVRLHAVLHVLRRGGEPVARYVADARGSAGNKDLAYYTESVLQEVIENSEGELRSMALAELERMLKGARY
jgi:hypothetical protein